MKASPSKGAKVGAGVGKKRSRNEAEGSAQESTPPTSPPRPNPNKEWKKSKSKTEDLLALVNSWFLREKEMTCGVPPQEIRTRWRKTPTRFPCSPGSWSAD
jgi:hypothetical protein